MAVLFLSPLTLLQAQKLGTGCESSHTVVIKEDGKAYSWGYNRYGQLGNSEGGTSAINRKTPVAVFPSPIFKAIAMGQYHTIALTSGGVLVTWGCNSDGQLGNNDAYKNDRYYVTEVYTGYTKTPGAIFGKTITAVAAGYKHSAALDSDGKVYTWGSNFNEALGTGNSDNSAYSIVPEAVYTAGVLNGKKIKEIAAGYCNTAALDENGKIYT